MGDVRFGKSSYPSYVPASVSEEGWFLKIAVKWAVISLKISSLVVRTLPLGAMIFSMLHLRKLFLARFTWNIVASYVSGPSKQREQIPKPLSVLSSHDWVFSQLLEGNPVKRFSLGDLLNTRLIERPCLPNHSCPLLAIAIEMRLIPSFRILSHQFATFSLLKEWLEDFSMN